MHLRGKNTMMSPLDRSEVVAAIERRKPVRIPMVLSKWWGEGLWEQYGDRLREFDRFPDDAPLMTQAPFELSKMDLPWRVGLETTGAHDAGGALPEWRHLDAFVEAMPDPNRPGAMDDMVSYASSVREQGRYVLWGFWHFFFEMPWQLRGMENLMVDYYENPDEVHRMHDILCTQYEAWIRRAGREVRPDGFFTSDDLGHQTQSMVSPPMFREFLKPYYARVAKACHENGMHFWLHSCGNNGPLMDDLIDAGVDVFHPVQKHTMDERQVVQQYGDRIAFLVGIDVQHVLQEGSPEDVRAEVRHLIDTFDRPGGGMCMAAGNGIVSGTPFENIEAYLDEAIRYGLEHRSRFA